MRLKYIDGIMGFAIGDAMGMPLEGASRDDLLKKPITKMTSNDTCFAPGTWSDDTSMMIATIDSINTKNNVDLTDMALKFVAFKNHAQYTANNEPIGLLNTCKRAIDNFAENHDDPTTCGLTTPSSNEVGALMRILPIAYYSIDKKLKDFEILDLVKKVSSITNAHEISFMASYIYVRFVMFLLTGKDKLSAYSMTKCVDYTMFSEDTRNEFNRLLKEDISKLKINDIKSDNYVVSVLEAAIWVFLQSENYKEAIIGAINLGEKTDTIGALTGALAGINYGYDFIPSEWKENIVRKEYLLDIIEEFSENKY